MDAKDFLNRLTDLLYDESVAFSSTDKDGMKEVIEQIEERVNQLEIRIKTESEDRKCCRM